MVKTQTKRKSFRENLADKFLRALEETPRDWHKAWSFTESGIPVNAAKGNQYTGLNLLWLKYVEKQKNYGDNRWATFKQCQEKGWKVKAGEHGTRIEYFMPIDQKEGHAISWEKYNGLSETDRNEVFEDPKSGLRKERYVIRGKEFVVFNGKQIEGIPELPNGKSTYKNITPDVVVERVATGMGVKLVHDENGSRAYYKPVADEIHLPEPGQFHSDYEYNAVALHELGHATGHESRLDRDLTSMKNKSEYAYEELIAEITSCFMGEWIEEPMSESNMENHLAYVQGWAKAIRDNKNYLFQAIKEAEKAADYMVERGELNKLREAALKEREKMGENEVRVQNALDAMAPEEYTLLKILAENLDSDCKVYYGMAARGIGKDSEYHVFRYDGEQVDFLAASRSINYARLKMYENVHPSLRPACEIRQIMGSCKSIRDIDNEEAVTIADDKVVRYTDSIKEAEDYLKECGITSVYEREEFGLSNWIGFVRYILTERQYDSEGDLISEESVVVPPPVAIDPDRSVGISVVKEAENEYFAVTISNGYEKLHLAKELDKDRAIDYVKEEIREYKDLYISQKKSYDEIFSTAMERYADSVVYGEPFRERMKHTLSEAQLADAESIFNMQQRQAMEESIKEWAVSESFTPEETLMQSFEGENLLEKRSQYRFFPGRDKNGDLSEDIQISKASTMRGRKIDYGEEI